MRVGRFLAVLLAAASVAAAAQAAPGDGGPPQNYAVAKATRDSDHVDAFRFQVASYGGTDGSPTNVAWAESNGCTGCSTSAVAVQVVFLTGTPATIAPRNVAYAVNTSCTSCTSYAYAYQYVVVAGRAVRLSGSAREKIASIRAQMEDVSGQSSLTDAQRSARLDELGAQLRAVVDGDLASAHVAHRDVVRRQDDHG